MPLSNLVASARRNAPIQKQIIYKVPAPRFIDADAVSVEKIEEQQKERQSAKQDWRECKYLKEVSNTYYCTHFMSKCACEKCNGTLPSISSKKNGMLSLIGQQQKKRYR